MADNKDNKSVVTTQPQQGQMPPQPMMGGGYNPMMGGGMMPGMMPVVQNFIAEPIHGVPAGLEVLHLTEHLFIRQSIDMAEYLYNAPNKYEVLDTWGRRVFYVVETTSFWDRNCCNCTGAFQCSVLNFSGQEVMFARGSTGCCCDGTVSVGQGDTLFGTSNQICACCVPKLDTRDASGKPIFTIEGPTCSFGYADYDISQAGFDPTRPENLIGRISKQWSGFLQEMYTHADNYGISFPAGLDVTLKAVLLGAALLIDFKYYNQRMQHHR